MKRKGFDDCVSDAICFMVTEQKYDLGRLRKLDVASFMVLLDYLEEQGKKLKKGKKNGRRKN